MPQKIYAEHVPEPTRFEALAGPYKCLPHDEHSNLYSLEGSVASEEYWEGYDQTIDSHTGLRAEAIERMPAMLRQLVEAYDLLADMSDRGEIDGPGYSPDWRDEDDRPDHTGERLRRLSKSIGHTLEALEDLGERLGLERFAVAVPTPGGPRPADGERFDTYSAALVHAEALCAQHEADRADDDEPEYFVVTVDRVDNPQEWRR